MQDIKDLLFKEAQRINQPDFALSDPVQFPKAFTTKQDIEIAAILAATLAWGNRKMIIRDVARLLDFAEGEPLRWLMHRDFECIDDDANIHRTIFGRDIKWLLRGLRKIYGDYGSLDDLMAHIDAEIQDATPWDFAEAINGICTDVSGDNCQKCLPSQFATTALKRVNMALRWLVRNDGIVDIGVWQSLTPDRLYIPLDVHVGNTARSLGLLQRKANDRRSCRILTEALRKFNPTDPTLFDFALFGIGVEKHNTGSNQNE